MSAAVHDESGARAFSQALRTPAAVRFFPIRHHSPACAWQLTRALQALKPRHVLIEMPEDFAHLIPLLTDAALRPPAAIVAFPESPQNEAPGVPGYWPISATAPELAAIRVAARQGATVGFIDSGAGSREMREDEKAPAVPPRVLTQELHFDHSTYARALAGRLGCRDINELWDRLFESRLTDASWESFFADVGAWCFMARCSTLPAQLEREGTLAREQRMRWHIARVLNEPAVAVVTGGFHTPALLQVLDRSCPQAAPARAAGRGSRAYLVRFSHPRLDALSGYSAGLPSPRYYERLLAAVERGELAPHQAVAEELFLDLAAHLRAQRPGFAPSVASLVEALRHATGLAQLRGLAGPLRSELLDATRAALLKDEDPRYASPLLFDLHQRLVGTAIGDVPPGAGSPPLVEAVRRQARALGFTLTDSVTRHRKLDIHRNPRHRAASRLLHAMTLLGVDLGTLEQGADYAYGVDLDALHEIWSYAWSPLVETQLIELAAGGDDLQAACMMVLLRRCASLNAQGKGHNAHEAALLVFAAARAGVEPPVLRELLRQVEAHMGLDADLTRVTGALEQLLLLWAARPVLGLTGEEPMAQALARCYRRAVCLMDTLAATPGERARDIARALLTIRDVTHYAAELDVIDGQLFSAAVDRLLEADLPPLLQGVMAGLGVQLERHPQAVLSRCAAGALAGAQVTFEDRVAPLAGMLMVLGGTLARMEEVVAGIDAALGGLSEDTFIQLLPHLRAAFTELAPAECEALGAVLAQRHGSGPEGLALHQPIPVSTAELAANVASAAALTALWRQDGLAAWLPGKTA